MAISPRMNWPYPNDNTRDWFDAFKAFVDAADASGFASRDDRHLILAGGGTIAWSASTSILSWSDTLRIVCPLTGFQLRVAAASVSITDGQVLYVPLTRAPTQNVVVLPVVSGQVPSTDMHLTLAIRIGTKIYWRNGMMMDSGVSFLDIGGGQGGGGGLELPWVDVYQYTQVGIPVEETVNYGYFDGSSVSGTAYFWAMLTPTFGAPGTAYIRLYDVGPAVGPPAAPVLVATLSTPVNGGPQYLEQALAVATTPGVNQIADSKRMYEVRVYQLSTPGDVVFIGAGGMAAR